MLILTRRLNEKLTIGSDIKVTVLEVLEVLEVKGNQVRLGISAPKSVQVRREEIYDRIRQEAAAASAHDPENSNTAVPIRAKKSTIL